MLTQDVVKKALGLGWTQNEILLLNGVLPGGDFISSISDVYYWGMVGELYTDEKDHKRIFYKGQSPNSTKCSCPYQATAYADGSGTIMSKTAGIGVYIEEGFPVKKTMIAENIGLGTNNRAELAALSRAMREYPCINKSMLIKSDSEYAIGSVTKPWTASANEFLVAALRQELAIRNANSYNIKFEHVYGHSGHEGNEIADGLANIGRKVVSEVTYYP